MPAGCLLLGIMIDDDDADDLLITIQLYTTDRSSFLSEGAKMLQSKNNVNKVLNKHFENASGMHL